jgi:O-antigen ligase
MQTTLTSQSILSIKLLPFIVIAVLLAALGAVYPPYSPVAVLALVAGSVVIIARPDIAFAGYFGVQTLLSEDILMMNEQLAPTLYRINLPGIGLNVFEVAVVVLFIATLLQRQGRFYSTGLEKSVWLFGLACVLGYLTCIYLYHEPGRLFEPRRLLHFFLSYFFTVNLIRSKESLKWFLLIYAIAIILKSFQGVYLFYGGEGLQVKWRIRAIFTGWGDSLNFMTYMIFLAMFLLDKVKLPKQWIFLLFTPTVLYCFLFAYKRAYYVAFAVGLCIMFLLLKKQARVRFMGLAVVGAVLLFMLITVAGQWQAITMRLTSIFDPTKESSANYRLIEYQNACISISKHPLFGIGLGGVMPMEIHLSRTNLLGVHNTFLWAAVKMGVFGLFTYLLLNVVFIKQLIRNNYRLHDPFLRTVSRAILCALIAFLAAQMFAPMFSQIRTATWMGVFMAMGMLLPHMDHHCSAKDESSVL